MDAASTPTGFRSMNSTQVVDLLPRTTGANPTMHRAEPAPARPTRGRRHPVALVLLATVISLGAAVASWAGSGAASAATASTTASATASTIASTAASTAASKRVSATDPLTSHAVPAGPAPKGGSVSAYWLVGADGGIFAFGGAPYYGSMGGTFLYRPVVGLTSTGARDWGGYREVATDGGIFAFGDAGFYGSMGGTPLNRPIVGMVATPDGKGYWLVASDGGVFAFGDAGFFGSMGGTPLNQPVVGMEATPDGNGYWLVAADGGVFAFGDAGFFGSTGDIHLVSPIVSMSGTHDGLGYLLTAADGGVFAFGDAPFYGSLGATPKTQPIASLADTLDGGGYWMVNSNGAVTAFGDATYWGSTPQFLAAPIVAIVQAPGTGAFTASDYPSASYGYDISNYQCGDYPPAPHTVAVVQVVGASFGRTNPCLSGEAAWAGGGLNLYMYLTYGDAASSGDGACASTGDVTSCNYGFNAAVDAFSKAESAGINAGVPWWLDVEDPSFQGHTTASAALVQGALDGLRFEGINSVGIYASPGNWKYMVGDYEPSVPYWAADWQLLPWTTCGNIRSIYPVLPSGPVQIIQYGAPSYPLPLGGMSTSFDDDYAC